MAHVSRRGIPPLILLFMLTACGGDGITGPGGRGWTFETVVAGQEMGLHSALALDSEGTVHLAWHDFRQHKLHLSRRIAAREWSDTLVDSVGWMGSHVALHIDAADTLHLAYHDSWLFQLRYARHDGSSWHYEHLRPPLLPLSEGGEAATFLPRPDGLHLVEMYSAMRRSDANGKLRYWIRTPAGWELQSEITDSDLRPFVGFAWGPGGPVLGVLNKFVPSGRAVRAAFSVKRLAASTPAGPWTGTVISGVTDNPRALEYGDRAIAVGFDSGGTGHLLYLAPGGELRDTAGGLADTGVSNGQIVMRSGPGGDLYATWVKGLSLIAGRYAVGTGWEKVSAFSGFDHDGRYDFHVEDNGTLHVSFYHRGLARLCYGRKEVTP